MKANSFHPISEKSLDTLLKEVASCDRCSSRFQHQPNPVVQIGKTSRILIVGQAPGRKVHETGIPWNDKSGVRLRNWMNISEADFYNKDLVSIMSMAFCYPGKSKNGDLPPAKECAPVWHEALLENLKNIGLVLLVGGYSQQYYLKDKLTATERIKNFSNYLPFMPLPHPSPRNFHWFMQNPWFDKEVIPVLKDKVNLLK